MRMLETCTHSASRCIYIHIGYLLVLVPFTITKCVCVSVACVLAASCVRHQDKVYTCFLTAFLTLLLFFGSQRVCLCVCVCVCVRSRAL